MSSQLRRVRRAVSASAEQRRQTPREPVHDLSRFTPQQRERFDEIWGKATNYMPNVNPAWSILTDDEVIEMSDLYAASEVKE